MDKGRRLWLICMWVAILNGRVDALKKVVCVVGAGPGGLTAIKQLSMWPDDFQPIGFEKNSDVGGQWIYTDSTDLDEHGLPVHSSIYKNLRTNGPKQLIAFPDYQEFYGENRSYVKHETVLEYVRNYTTHFNLRPFIKLNTLVTKVGYDDDKWVVKVKNLNTNFHDAYKCDAVMISVGNFQKPDIPKIPGIEKFRGRVLHSHIYRKPEEFTNQVVVILGTSFSGIDIGLELCAYAKKVYLSYRLRPLTARFPPNMEQIQTVVAADETELILRDNSRIKADSFILCTGYLYDYPFLSLSTDITVDSGKFVYPLYKHFVNVKHPTMAMLGLLHPGLPFQVLYVQSFYFTEYLRGNITLPSETEMLKDAELPPRTAKRKAHNIDAEILLYYNQLAQASGALPLPPFFPSLVYLWFKEITTNQMYYKENNFIIHDCSAELVNNTPTFTNEVS